LRMRYVCNWKGHFVVHEDEKAMFYQTLFRHVKNEGRLELHREFYNDDPSRVNNMKLVGNWKEEDNSLNVLDRHEYNSRQFNLPMIPGKSLDEGLVPLMSNQDVLSLLQYVPIYKEIKVYVEKNTMEVVLGTGKGVVIEEVMEDNEVKEASETQNSGKQLFDHPPWSSESMNEKRNKGLSEDFQFRKMLFDIDLTFGLDFSHETLDMKNKVKAEQEMEEPVHNDFHPLMYEDDLLQKEDLVNYQQDPYHKEDEAEENAELFDEQDHLLEHVPFLKEIVVIVDGDALLLAIDALVVPPVIVLDKYLERSNNEEKVESSFGGN
ncbi:hypothetical protein Tco_0723912, partial [Tanacetum coccineum]